MIVNQDITQAACLRLKFVKCICVDEPLFLALQVTRLGSGLCKRNCIDFKTHIRSDSNFEKRLSDKRLRTNAPSRP